MLPKICSITECTNLSRSRGWCNTHYERWRRNGDPTKVYIILGDDKKRFWTYVEKLPTCWTWTGFVTADGYGRFSLQGKNPLAHRVSYEWANASIPEGLEVDHICHNRVCVNPAHLRLVSRKQNQENRSGATARSKSGVRGVFWTRGKWEARVKHRGRMNYAGRFDSIAEAEAAVIAKRNELFTHNIADRSA